MNFLSVIGMIGLTILCWGVYGPLIHEGQNLMDHSRFRPFMCVGAAYFLIAVVAPVVMLKTRAEAGRWTASGTWWSLIAGAAGALGAMGVIMAFNFKGSPIYVMPLVFGGAPVVNSFMTIFMAKTGKQVGPVFLAGLIMVVLGAVLVMIFKPGGSGADLSQLGVADMVKILGSIGVVVFCWGVYGPVLHKGQMKMEGSRLRPLICVGLAYFAIAVVVPGMVLGTAGESGQWSLPGTFWSLGAGAAGAIGALGVIMAFNFGGKPIYVMPLIFGGAPVVNTFTSIIRQGGISETNTVTLAVFIAGLLLVALGAGMVLVFAPKGAPPAAKAKETPDGGGDNNTKSALLGDSGAQPDAT